MSKTCEHDVHTVECTYTVSDTCSKSNSSIMYCKNENIYQGTKVIMQGKFIAVAYTLRTYRNQFSLGGICKQE